MRTFHLIITLSFLASTRRGQVSAIPWVDFRDQVNLQGYSPPNQKHSSATFLPGHPKKRGGESTCVQIPEALCSDDKPVRQAGHIAISKDGSLLAVSEWRGSEIFIYETGTMKLRQTLDAGHGEDSIRDFMFIEGPRPKLVVSCTLAAPASHRIREVSRIFDLEEELVKRASLEAVVEKTFEAFSDAVEEHMHWNRDHISRDLVSGLVWEMQYQKDLAQGKAIYGYRVGHTLDGKSIINDNFPSNRTVIDMSQDVPQQRFSVPYSHQGRVPIPPVIRPYPKPSVSDRSFVAVLLLDERKLQILDAQTGEIESIFPLPDDFPTPDHCLWCTCGDIVFSPDGRLATVRGYSIKESQLVWQVESGAIAYSILFDASEMGPHHTVQDISFSPDGKFLLFATTLSYDVKGAQPTVSVYDATSGEKRYDWVVSDLVSQAASRGFVGERLYPNFRNISNRGKFQYSAKGLVITGLVDGSIALYDPNTDRDGLLPSPTTVVDDTETDDDWMSVSFRAAPEIALSPDGKMLYSADLDGRIRVWKLEN